MDGIEKTTQETPQETGEQIAAAQIGDSSPLQAGGTSAAPEALRETVTELPDVDSLITELQPEYRAALDPASPDFDREQWREAQEQLNAAYLEKLETPQQLHPDIVAAVKELGSSAEQREKDLQEKGYHIERGESGEPNAIILNVPPYNPKLDPDSPEFDIELWKEEFSKVDLTAARERMQESAAHIAQSVAEQLTPEYFDLINASLQNTINNTAAALRGTKAISETIKNAVLNASRIAAESQRMIRSITEVITPEYMQLVRDILTRIAIDLPPEELEALQIAAAPPEPEAEETPQEDANQLSLFEDDKPAAEERATEDAPGDFIQLFAEKPALDTAPRKITAAKEEGALVSFERAAFTTTEEMLTALTRESIFMLPNETDLQDFDERGEITQLSFTKRPPQHIEVAQTGLFGVMLFSVIASYSPETQENNTVVVYVPKVLEALGIEVRSFSKRVKRGAETMQELRYKKMLELLQPFDRWIGRFQDGSFYRFLTIESYNPESETMRIISPYLFEIVRRNDSKRYTFLAHPDIANERNQAAVEIAMRLLQGLQKRGTSIPDSKTYKSKAKPKKKTIKTEAPDGTKTTVIEEYQQEQQPQELLDTGKPAVFTYEYSYKNIIRDCPQIRYELEKIESRTGESAKTAKQAYNAKLKQTFTAAFRILLEKTDAPLYYKNLHFTNVFPTGDYILPTKTTLTSYIGLEHNGRNKAYKAT